MKRVQATVEQLEAMLHEPVEDGYDPPALLDNNGLLKHGQYIVAKVQDRQEVMIIASTPSGSDPFYTGTNKNGLFAFFGSDIVERVTFVEYQQFQGGA